MSNRRKRIRNARLRWDQDSRFRLLLCIALVSVVGLLPSCGNGAVDGSMQSQAEAPLRIQRVDPAVLSTGSARSLVVTGDGFAAPLHVQMGQDTFEVREDVSPHSFRIKRPADADAAVGAVPIVVQRADGSRVIASDMFRYSASRVEFSDSAILPIPGVSDLAVMRPPVFGDLDGDGHAELVLVETDMHINLLRLQADGTLSGAVRLLLPDATAGDFAVGASVLHRATSGDQLLLLVMNNAPSGGVPELSLRTYSLAAGAGPVAVLPHEVVARGTALSLQQLDTRDYDDDGKDDIAVFYSDGDKYRTTLWGTDGRPSAPLPLRQQIAALPSIIADLDRDGYPDMVVLRDAKDGRAGAVEFYWNVLADETTTVPFLPSPTRCVYTPLNRGYFAPLVDSLGPPGRRQFGLLLQERFPHATRLLFVEPGMGDRSRGCGQPHLLAIDDVPSLAEAPLAALADWDGDDELDAIFSNGLIGKFALGEGRRIRGLIPSSAYRFGRLVQGPIVAHFATMPAVIMGQVHAADLSAAEGLLFLQPQTGRLPPVRYLSTQNISTLTVLPQRPDGGRSLLLGSDRGVTVLSGTGGARGAPDALSCPLPVGSVYAAVVEQTVSRDEAIVSLLVTTGPAPLSGSWPVQLVRYRLHPQHCWTLLSATELPPQPSVKDLRMARYGKDALLAVLAFSSDGRYMVKTLLIYAQGMLKTVLTPPSTWNSVGDVVSADLDGDGADELILRTNGGAYLGRDDQLELSRLLQDATVIGEQRDVADLAVDDFTGDGIADVAMLPNLSGNVRIYSMQGRQSDPQLWSALSHDIGSVRIGGGDLDGDGRAEVLLSFGSWDWLLIRAFPSDGSVDPSRAPVLARGERMVTVDLDGDAKPEIVTVDNTTVGAAGVVVFRNLSK